MTTSLLLHLKSSLWVGLILLGLISGSASAQDKPTINWSNFNISPGGILNGPFEGQGVGDLFYQTYKAALPEYEHSLTYANPARMRRIIRESKNSCIVYIFHLPEYSKHRYWGPINYIAPPNRIITTKKVAPKLSKTNLSLAQILEMDAMRLGAMGGRMYRVQDILEKNKNNPNLLRFSTPSKNLYQMLLAGRIEYTLGDWTELTFMEKTLGVENQFVTFAMKELTGYTPNFVSCTKNAWGKEVVNKLHARFNHPDIIEQKTLPSILNWVRQPDKEAYAKEYKRFVQQHFKKM
jgi:uncharacterized protein (TIGR02285 family)